MVQGRKPNWARRRRVLQMRQRGLTLKEIGRRLGITPSAVFWTAMVARRPQRRSVPCCACRSSIVSAGILPRDREGTFCVPCLARSPQATFGQRLKAFRLAAGLTRTELARRAGINLAGVLQYEDDRFFPRARRHAALARALGLTPEQLGRGAPVPGKRPPGRPPKVRCEEGDHPRAAG
jgi:transcriptional regulator with XRE-family HTH domain